MKISQKDQAPQTEGLFFIQVPHVPVYTAVTHSVLLYHAQYTISMVIPL
jgi:hypothetical protein